MNAQLQHPHQDARSAKAPPAPMAERTQTLLDLMYDGFYLLFLLKGKHPPADADVFRERIKQFLTQFERGATRLNAPADDIYACKFAFCATVDEAVLMSPLQGARGLAASTPATAVLR